MSVPDWLHAVGIITIILSSAVGVALPILSIKSKRLRRILTEETIRNAKIFGTGSILSTAFVHLFGTGFDDILKAGNAFGRFGPQSAGIVCLVGVFMMMSVDFAMQAYQQSRLRSRKPMESGSDQAQNGMPTQHAANLEKGAGLPETLSPSSPSCPTATVPRMETAAGGGCCSDVFLLEALANTQRKMGLYALEFGIAFHSIIVGVTLGISKDIENYGMLLMVVLIHQFLEGFALGSIATPLNLGRRAVITLVLLFSLTTAGGALIGAIASRLAGMSDDSVSTRATRGVFSALSAGIMIYTSIVEAVLPELRSSSFHERPCRYQLLSLFMFLFGAALMSLAAFGEEFMAPASAANPPVTAVVS